MFESECGSFHVLLDTEGSPVEGALGAEGGLPADDDTKDFNADSDGYIDVDTDEFSDTASVSSGASTGSVGQYLLMLFVYWFFVRIMEHSVERYMGVLVYMFKFF